jgi:hypothetical protein
MYFILDAQGWSVFWDPAIEPGQRWDDLIAAELEGARCVVVIWSLASVLCDCRPIEEQKARASRHSIAWTKSWLRSLGESRNGNDYGNWLRTENESYRERGIKKLLAGLAQSDWLIAPTAAKILRTSDYRFAVDVRVQTQELEAHLHVVERIASEVRGKHAHFIPIRFAVTNKLTKDDKLLLAFDAFVLTQALRCDVNAGKIIR